VQRLKRNASKRKRINTMKTITSAVLGLSLTLATAGLSLAAQAPTAPAPVTGSNAPVAKKHVKKHKKAEKNTAVTATAPAAAPAK
jgi:hypothetical protein